MNEPNGRNQVYELGRSFQDAWPSEIDDYLDKTGLERREAVVLLCNIDMELRWRRDREGRAEDYFRRYPAEWAASGDEALELIEEEFAQRQKYTRLEAFCEDYAGRYPGLMDHLCRQFPPASPTLLVPRYRDARPFRQGGLGEVFIAFDEQLGRKIALKRIQNGRRGDPRSRARFVQEAETTGRLEHPGIVPVYSMEREADGQICYAMRLIEPDGGESLHDAIKRFHHPVAKGADPGARALELRRLLSRLVSVCRTISYAHSRNILHRDLKPGNIMLGPFGETLVVDWGLAKSFAGLEVIERADDLDSPHSFEPEASLPGWSPGYSSPEQAEGRIELMGPASDVYSLGATLYSILTGRPPGTEPGEPESSTGDAGVRVVPPRQVEPTVPRALEQVCLKAMTYRPEDRFQTPAALADDLERWLAGEPVRCWREPATTRARRWISRHRTFTSVATAMMLLTVLGLAEMSRREQAHQSRLASEELRADVEKARGEKAREVAQARTEELKGTIASAITLIKDDPTLNAPGLKNLRDGLLDSIQRSLTRLAEVPDTGEMRDLGTVEVWRSMGLAAGRLGDADSVAAARRELASAKAQADRHPGVPVHREILAICLLNLGNLLEETGKLDEARGSFREALALLGPLVRDHPDEPSYRANTAKLDLSMGQLLQATGDVDEARLAYRRGIDLLEPLVLDHPSADRYRFDLAKAFNTLGILQSMGNDAGETMSSYRRALDLRTALVHEHPTVAEYRSDLARTHVNIGNLQDGAGARDDAFRSFGTAVEILEPLCRDNPALKADRMLLATSHNNLGAMYLKGGRAAESMRSLRRGLEVGEALVIEEPKNLAYLAKLANIYSNLGALQNDILHDPAEAFISQSKALEQRKRLVENSAAIQYQEDLAKSWLNLALVQAALKRPEEEMQAYREALKLRAKLPDKHPGASSNLSMMGKISQTLGLALNRNGQGNESLEFLRKAAEFQRRALVLSPRQEYRDLLFEHHAALASILFELDRPDEAITALVESRLLWEGDGVRLHRLARTLARYAASNDGKAGVRIAAVRERFADAAMETLRKAINAGYGDVSGMEKDERLAPLRGREDFRQLMTKLKER